MLTKFLLKFQDQELRHAYHQDKKALYVYTLPVLTIFLLIGSISMELIYRLEWFESGVLTMWTEIVNWLTTVLFVVLSLLVRKYHFAQWFVCPILTAFCCYYFTMVDYDGTLQQIYFTSSLGTTAIFFIVVMFSEVWLMSTLVYAPMIAYYLIRTSSSLDLTHIGNLAVRCLFAIFVYASVAYKIELLSKHSFLGKQSYEKSFHRWLKIFETFPEGIAMVRNEDSIMYANSSLKKLLDIDGQDEPRPKSDGYFSNVGMPFNEQQHNQMKSLFEATKIKKWSKDSQQNSKNRETSVWDFIERNDKGATYEFKGIGAPLRTLSNVNSAMANDNTIPEQLNPMSQGNPSGTASTAFMPLEKKNTLTSAQGQPQTATQSSGGSRRFLSLNQVTVKIAGRKEKIFIVRDESHTIFLEQLMETKELMQDFTTAMMEQLDDYSRFTQSTLKELEGYVMPEGRPIVDDCSNEMRKTRYRIRDYRDIYDISENDFYEPGQRRVDIRASLREIVNVASSEIHQTEVEVTQTVHDSTPALVAVDQDLFVQVMINLLLQSITAIGSRGYIKITTYKKHYSNIPHLVVDLDASKYQLDKQKAVNIRNLTSEKDFKRIMASEVEINFKIAKVLSNSLGWKIEFNSFTASRYSLYIPLIHQLSDAEPMEGDIAEESKEDNVARSTPLVGTGGRCFSKQTQRDKYFITQEQLDEFEDGRPRPYTAQVPEIGGRSAYIFRPVKEHPDLENANNSPPAQSSKSFAFPGQCCATTLLMNSIQVQYFQEKLGLKCKEVYTFQESCSQVKKALYERKKCGCEPYKFFIIDLDDPKGTIIKSQDMKYVIPEIKKVVSSHPKAAKLPPLKIIAIATTWTPAQKALCDELGVIFIAKSGNEEKLKALIQDKRPAQLEESKEQPTHVATETEQSAVAQ